MKTWTGEKKEAPKMEKGCCGSVNDRIGLIRGVSNGLRDGHFGIASLYETIAEEMEDKKEKKMFQDIAAKHRKMGDESLEILIPDNYEGPAL